MIEKTNKFNIVIPARLASTRLPGKVLLEHQGQSLIRRVISQAQKVKSANIIVATEDDEILKHLSDLPDIHVIKTPPLPSGTKRSFYVASKLKLSGSLITWQADEPLIEPQWVEHLAQKCLSEKVLATLITPNDSLDEFLSTSCVKVVCDKFNKALYFSRSPIPGTKDSNYKKVLPFHQHLGIYAFNVELIPTLDSLDSQRAKKSYNLEDLEQLTWLYEGFDIYCHEVNAENLLGIDTSADWNNYCELLGS